MLQEYRYDNWVNDDGNPAGGYFSATGVAINWQDGPIKEAGSNGGFVETVLEAVVKRLEFYQDSQFACRENALAITKIQEALHWLDHRTNDRTKRGVEGTHQK